MIKKVKNKVYDTDNASVVKKVTSGYYGDPAGYETTMYVTADGDYFLYTNGGESSPFKEEKITSYTKANAAKWLDEN